MSGNGTMTFGDLAPFLIGLGVVVIAIVAFLMVRMFRRSCLTARLVDQVLRDRPILPLLGDDDPGRQVYQRKKPPVSTVSAASTTRTTVTSTPAYSATPEHTPATMRPLRVRISRLVPL